MSDLPQPTLFADGKAPEALRTIGELAEALGVRQHVLRYWEEQFPMLRPLKRGGGRRYYRAEDAAMAETINRLVHREGYTLKGARAVIEGKSDTAPASSSVASQASPSGGTPPGGDFRSGLQAIRNRLAAAL
ncbi:MAG: MerR family transcriptional regulator [Novosphingobium sp.]